MGEETGRAAPEAVSLVASHGLLISLARTNHTCFVHQELCSWCHCSGKDKGERKQSPSSESTPVAHRGHSDPENALLLGSQQHWPCNIVTTAGKGDTGVCQESMQGSERREQNRRVHKPSLRKERKGRHAVLHTAHAQPSQ